MKSDSLAFLRFTRGERTAIILLVILILIVFIAPRAYIHYFYQPVVAVNNLPPEVLAFLENQNRLAAIPDTASDNFIVNPYDMKEDVVQRAHKVTLFAFNPNEITAAQWQQLGFTARQAEAIERYKQRGGKFKKPEDLKRLYVITEAKYAQLLPYIQLPAPPAYDSVYVRKEYTNTPKQQYVVDINEADSSLFERQRGIGPSLARRIVNYRKRLGGFVSVEQIAEVWGMPDSTYQALKPRFTVTSVEVQKLNINSLPFDSLKTHPYINYNLAKVIVNYRSQHGPFARIDDLQNVSLVTDSIYRKLQPYITTQ